MYISGSAIFLVYTQNQTIYPIGSLFLLTQCDLTYVVIYFVSFGVDIYLCKWCVLLFVTNLCKTFATAGKSMMSILNKLCRATTTTKKNNRRISSIIKSKWINLIYFIRRDNSIQDGIFFFKSVYLMKMCMCTRFCVCPFRFNN